LKRGICKIFGCKIMNPLLHHTLVQYDIVPMVVVVVCD
jgi:hypothetical protein